MPAEVRSGSSNLTYVNNTTQNVRLIINYMTNVTSMTWSSSSGGNVTITATATNIGKDIPVSYSISNFQIFLPTGLIELTNNVNKNSNTSRGTVQFTTIATGPGRSAVPQSATETRVPVAGTGTLSLTPSANAKFPTELMLASGHSFSAVCGAYNAIAIREDGN